MSGVQNAGRNAWVLGLIVIILAAAAIPVRRPASTSHLAAASDTLIASLRAEPRSFNRYEARDLNTAVITYLTQSALVRINRVTNALEPELAERWELLPDHQTYRLYLRPNVQFSDGAAFSADDVVFSFEAIYDANADTVLADTLRVHNRPLGVIAENTTTVLIRFPAPFGPGLRLLDGVPILPRHRLAKALKAGTFRTAWKVTTPPSEIAGLGPFVLRRYDPGERLIFDRNPHYWRRASGRSLPRLSHVVLEILPDQDAEALALETGAIDMTGSEVRPSDIPGLRRAADRGRVTLRDLGVGVDGDLLWFNLSPAHADDTRAAWLRHRDFRRAISHSVDRDAFVATVYFGAAVPANNIVSPANIDWYSNAPAPSYDPGAATELLASLNLEPRADGVLRDRHGAPVRFTLLTQKGNTSLERGAAVIRENLARVGIAVDVVALEVGALIQRLIKGDYDAAYFRVLTSDTDPALNLDFWLSSGSAHMWNPEQRTPATRWESEIDRLMEQMSTSVDRQQRRELFAGVQAIVAREVPVLCFAFPRIAIAMHARITDATAAPFRPPILWNPAVIAVASSR
jgi:peptide/nickel transport system substrate-binding protein